MNTAHGTPQVTDEQIKTILHLVLQVYCSLSLKENLHNPVMPVLARNKERKESILHAHGSVCACVCVWLCVMWMCGWVHIYVDVCIITSAFRMADTHLQAYIQQNLQT